MKSAQELQKNTSRCPWILQLWMKRKPLKRRLPIINIFVHLVNFFFKFLHLRLYHNFSSDGYEKFLPPKEKPRVPLPEGWVEGTTTQKWSYRNPVILFPNIYRTRPTLFKPLCEMDEACEYLLNPNSFKLQTSERTHWWGHLTPLSISPCLYCFVVVIGPRLIDWSVIITVIFFDNYSFKNMRWTFHYDNLFI